MGIEWSDAQREVINSNDDRILVSASAGSGKTTVMIERILRLNGSGVKINNMLICTFTKASAADMRLKLYTELIKRGRKSELSSLSSADISTIDSFCQRLVTNYFYYLGIDPQFEVLEEDESKMLKLQTVKSVIASMRSDKRFDELYYYLSKRRKADALEDAMLSFIDFCGINPDVTPSYRYDEQALKAKMNEYLSDKRAKAEAHINTLFTVLDQPELKQALIYALDYGKDGTYPRIKKEFSHLGPCLDYVKSEVKEFEKLKNELANIPSQSRSREYIELFIKASLLARSSYAAEKQKRSAVDFSDLENMALSILKTDAITEIRNKYKYIFVDEYQDINPLQECLIETLAKDNKLFMVGDLKQSIYVFRGCEPGYFKSKYDAYKLSGNGKVIDLDTNYRSGKKIISFVNDVFAKVMTSDFGGVDYKSNPMIANKETEGYATLHLIEGEVEKRTASGIYSVANPGKNNLTQAEAKAAAIVYRIKELLKTEDEDGPVKPGDIAILSRKIKDLEMLVLEGLRKINVPVSMTEVVSYALRPETGQLIKYLHLIDNNRDDKALAISMLSPLGGFGENELAAIRNAGFGTFYECVLKAAALGDRKVREFFDKLDRYYNLSLTMSVDELVGLIVSENGYFNYAFSLGEEAAIVLDKFLEFLGGCPFKNSLSACLKFIDEYDPSTELVGDDNSVKMMTIHKSKGLEFKYVFVIGLERRFSDKDEKKDIYIGKEIAMSVFEDHRKYCSDLMFVIDLIRRKKQLDEELRILYVAFTRAKVGLEVFGSIPSSLSEIYSLFPDIVELTESKSPIGWLLPIAFMADRIDAEDIEVEEADRRKVLIGKADEKAEKQIRDYFAFVSPVVAPAKSYVSRIAHSDDEPAALIAPPGPTEGNALERGNAYHRGMEKLDFFDPDLSVIDKNDLELIDSEKLLFAANAMTKFSGEVFKEQPFMIRLSASEVGMEGEGNVLVQGVIDLMFIEGDEATIIDYKTGKAHSRFEAGYFKQVELYAKAVSRLLKKKIKSKYLYYFDSKTFVKVE